MTTVSMNVASSSAEQTENSNNSLGIGATKRVIFSYPMVRQTDMTEEMKNEVILLIEY